MLLFGFVMCTITTAKQFFFFFFFFFQVANLKELCLRRGYLVALIFGQKFSLFQ